MTENRVTPLSKRLFDKMYKVTKVVVKMPAARQPKKTKIDPQSQSHVLYELQPWVCEILEVFVWYCIDFTVFSIVMIALMAIPSVIMSFDENRRDPGPLNVDLRDPDVLVLKTVKICEDLIRKLKINGSNPTIGKLMDVTTVEAEGMQSFFVDDIPIDDELRKRINACVRHTISTRITITWPLSIFHFAARVLHFVWYDKDKPRRSLLDCVKSHVPKLAGCGIVMWISFALVRRHDSLTYVGNVIHVYTVGKTAINLLYLVRTKRNTRRDDRMRTRICATSLMLLLGLPRHTPPAAINELEAFNLFVWIWILSVFVHCCLLDENSTVCRQNVYTTLKLICGWMNTWKQFWHHVSLTIVIALSEWKFDHSCVRDKPCIDYLTLRQKKPSCGFEICIALLLLFTSDVFILLQDKATCSSLLVLAFMDYLIPLFCWTYRFVIVVCTSVSNRF